MKEKFFRMSLVMNGSTFKGLHEIKSILVPSIAMPRLEQHLGICTVCDPLNVTDR